MTSTTCNTLMQRFVSLHQHQPHQTHLVNILVSQPLALALAVAVAVAVALALLCYYYIIITVSTITTTTTIITTILLLLSHSHILSPYLTWHDMTYIPMSTGRIRKELRYTCTIIIIIIFVLLEMCIPSK